MVRTDTLVDATVQLSYSIRRLDVYASFSISDANSSGAPNGSGGFVVLW
jgi:hypothetical protein